MIARYSQTPPIALCSLLVAVSVLVTAECGTARAEVVPLLSGHAHNDYRHRRPLLDALEHGFCSVEADVFLVDGQLLVGHSRDELTKDRTLQRLYLDPLRRRVIRNGGFVHAAGVPFYLLIDVKSPAEATYEALHPVLAEYGPMLMRIERGQMIDGPVHVVISGNRPIERIRNSDPRYAGIDGRLSDLSSTDPNHLLPWISDNWSRHFTWKGDGPMPDQEREKLHRIVNQAHAAGRLVRFWATPERESVWRELEAAGVNFINTDDLAGLRAFLVKRQPDDSNRAARHGHTAGE